MRNVEPRAMLAGAASAVAREIAGGYGWKIEQADLGKLGERFRSRGCKRIAGVVINFSFKWAEAMVQ